MNGAQDLGGMMGFGPIAPEPNEPIFHHEWEKRALALTLAAGACGEWNIDMSRHARETLPPAAYLSKSYYDIWITALQKLLLGAGMVAGEELEEGRAMVPARPVKGRLAQPDVAKALASGSPCDRPAPAPALFAQGETARTKVMHPSTHTRLPRYARGKIGVVEAVRGCFVFPIPTRMARAKTRIGATRSASPVRNCGARTPTRILKCRSTPGSPILNAPEAPPFDEPWQAQVFAMAVALNQRGLFSWSEWAQALGAEIAAGPQEAGNAVYFHSWLRALEKILIAKGVASAAGLANLAQAWRAAALATPHGQPIALGRQFNQTEGGFGENDGPTAVLRAGEVGSGSGRQSARKA